MTTVTTDPQRTLRGPLARLLALLALLAGAATATTYPQLEPEAMLDRADIVAFAEVVAVRGELRQGRPWTVVEFAPRELLRFPLPEDEDGEAPARFELAFLGGEAGDARLTVAEMPGFEVGDVALLFAYDRPYASPIVGFRQGLWFVRGGVLRDPDGRLLDLADGALARGGDGVAPADLLPYLLERTGEQP